jgi:hypothetical protein
MSLWLPCGFLGFLAASITFPVTVICVGVLYSLYGRNLDSGEAVPYNDQHWRNVVARLHLTQQQVRSSRDTGMGARCVTLLLKPSCT